MDWLRPKDRIVLLSNRLGSDTQKNDEFIDSMLEAVREEPGCIDEVWFATDYGFPPLSVHERSARRLSEVAEKIRSAGLRISLQLSNSIGHGEYMASRNNSGLVYEGSPVEHLVGPEDELGIGHHDVAVEERHEVVVVEFEAVRGDLRRAGRAPFPVARERRPGSGRDARKRDGGGERRCE